MLVVPGQIERELEAGGTLVVPTPQRAAAVELAYAAQRLGRSQRSWRSPDVLPWGAWLEREAWRAADAGERLARPLRSTEEWLLWQEATARAMEARGWPHVDTLADSLQAAAQLLGEWQIPVRVLHADAGNEGTLLAEVLAQVERRCEELGALPRHQLAGRLRPVASPRTLTFAGFGERTPARAQLLQAWALHARSAREHTADGAPGRAYAAAPRTADEELELAAHWCRARLREDPAARLLVMAPELAQHRARWLEEFRQVLTGSERLTSGAAAEPVAVEGGAPLSADRLLQHAFAGLHFLAGSLEAAELSAWLRDPFWAISSCERAQLDVWLRRVLPVETTPAELAALLGAAPGSLAASAQRLRSVLSASLAALGPEQPRTLADWVQRIEQALGALGWPGARALSAAEQQSRMRFQELLEDCVSLGVHLGAVPAARALQLLEQLAARSRFQAATGDCAITLSASLVDPIVRYDGIWIAGVHADSWPPPLSFNAFIPLAAQRKAGIPGTNPAAAVARARALLRVWQRTTAELIVSSPLHGEEQENLPCTLLAELSGLERRDLPAPRRSLAHTLRDARRTETLTDAQGLVWPSGQALPGGTRAIDYQSRCPFRAYAELRLKCAPLGLPRPGIDFRDRGRLLHRALELMWDRLHDLRTLLSEHEALRLVPAIEQCVTRAAAEVFLTSTRGLTPSMQRREQRRAVRAIQTLLTLERARAPFRVHALELKRALTLGDARIEVRIDRIDALEDGSYAIFDYKSGLAPTPGWLGDRLSDPQLLVYLLAAALRTTALALVQLAPERACFRGLADRPERLPGLAGLAGPAGAASWPQQVSRWRDELEQLAHAFLGGVARRDPAEGACDSCHLQALCRIAEANGEVRPRSCA